MSHVCIHEARVHAVPVKHCRDARGAIAFQFAQVGNDIKARGFLAKLVEYPVVRN